MQGHIHKRVRRDKSGKEQTFWYVGVDVGPNEASRRIQKWHGSFRTRKEAEAERARIVSDLNSGAYTVPSRVSFSPWVLDQWLPAMRSQVNPSTLDSYRRNMSLHVLPALESRPLQQITSADLNALYAELLASGQRGMASWSASELRSFLAFASGNRLYAAFHLAAMAGLRRGEVLGLRWSDVDLDARRLAV